MVIVISTLLTQLVNLILWTCFLTYLKWITPVWIKTVTHYLHVCFGVETFGVTSWWLHVFNSNSRIKSWLIFVRILSSCYDIIIISVVWNGFKMMTTISFMTIISGTTYRDRSTLIFLIMHQVSCTVYSFNLMRISFTSNTLGFVLIVKSSLWLKELLL